jgi:hypothetical protein
MKARATKFERELSSMKLSSCQSEKQKIATIFEANKNVLSNCFQFL